MNDCRRGDITSRLVEDIYGFLTERGIEVVDE
jgi:hypothetical protein